MSQGTRDNIKRGFRVVLKALAALLVSGAVDRVVVDWLDKYAADEAIRATVFLVMAWITSVVVDITEDLTGKSLLGIAPTDRRAGDAVLGDGLGAKQGTIVGDTDPVSLTEYREKRAA